MKDHFCVIGKFGGFGYDVKQLIEEIQVAVGSEFFPWNTHELIFHPSRTDLDVFFDQDFHKLIEGFDEENRLVNYNSLVAATYNLDSSSSAEGIFAKIILCRPAGSDSVEVEKAAAAVDYVIKNHQHILKGQKVKVVIDTQDGETWLKINTDYTRVITQHIYFGKRGESKKAHIFRKPNSEATHEQSPNHVHPEKAANFKQFIAVVVEKGKVHQVTVDPTTTSPVIPKPKSPKESS